MPSGGTVIKHQQQEGREMQDCPRFDIQKIAEQNDRFRSSLGVLSAIPGRIVLTASVAALDAAQQLLILNLLKTYSDFTPDSDPYETHEFGILEVPVGDEITKIYWRIDLYDADYRYGSEEPDNTDVTRRVLTLMMSHDL